MLPRDRLHRFSGLHRAKLVSPVDITIDISDENSSDSADNNEVAIISRAQDDGVGGNQMLDIGAHVKELRVNRKITQKELTARMGTVSTSYLANLESGRIQRPGRDKLSRIAEGLGVSLDQLIKGTTAETTVAENDRKGSRVWCYNKHCPEARTAAGGVWAGGLSLAAFNARGEPVHYCQVCGSLLLQTCPSCNRVIEGEGIPFCTGCGSDLQQEWMMQDDMDRDSSGR
jgi:transcriptional regulator with XRE-family HTH domain